MSCARCEKLAAQLREAQDELEAWRAQDRDAALSEAALERLLRWQAAFGVAALTACALIAFADRRGRTMSAEALVAATRRAPGVKPDTGSRIANVVVHKARRALAARRIEGEIQTLWGVGYVMPAATVDAVLRHVGEQA